MKLVFFSIVLNHHQSSVADAFYELLGSDYAFVELSSNTNSKGSLEDFSQKPYLLRAWESEGNYAQAMEYAKTADVCVFSGNASIAFESERLKHNLLTFNMSERPLKRGLINVLSQTNLSYITSYWKGNWRNKPLYKLCCSAFASSDYAKLHMFKNKCFKWGYFTHVGESSDVEASTKMLPHQEPCTPLMWCARFLMWKHPELPVLAAANLKAKGYRFKIDIFGDDCLPDRHDVIYPKSRLEELINQLEVSDCVFIKGSKPNDEIIREMGSHSIFLFTSDNQEGWGAVANESLANGCALIASDAIGSTPYLVKDFYNGLRFRSRDVDSLTEKIEFLLKNPHKLCEMRSNAVSLMRETWNPRKAATNLLTLINDIKSGRSTSIADGPCSKA